MSYLVWERDLDTGINVIDAQHHRIVEMINRLHAAQGTRRHDIVSEVVEELVDYTLFHFAFEETMIEEAGYPLTPEHKRIHDIFTAHVRELRERFRAGEDIGEELKQVLANWLFRHIRSEDKAYSETVLRHMAAAEARPAGD